MDFIIGLAHWCEIHGPTSILCTQVIPPSCRECNPPRSSLTRSPSTPQLSGGPTPPQSSHGYGRPNTTSNTSINSPAPRSGAAAHLGINGSVAPIPRLQSPTETPPGSPRSPTLTPASANTATPESCRNCTMTLPTKFDEEPGGAGSAGRGVSPPGRPLRTTETVVVGTPITATAVRDGERESRSQPPGSPKFSPAVQSLATHTHTVTYLSSRSPAQASRYSNVRQACIRSLSCELVPAQTGPILFGDQQTGYTMAVVFKLSDSKSRGGRRTYALLCMSMSQRALIQSWSVITSVFQNLVHEIQHAAAEKAAKDTPPPSSTMSSVGSRGPEGFLRRRTPADGASQKSLADLVGKDRFFVDIHSAFVRLLAGLSKMYGYGSATQEITADMMPLSIGASASADGRSRAGSVGSASSGERDKKAPPVMSTSQTAMDSPAPPVPPGASNINTQPFTPGRIDIVQTSSATTNPKAAAAVAAASEMAATPTPTLTTTTTTTTTMTNGSRNPASAEQVSRNIDTRRQVAVG